MPRTPEGYPWPECLHWYIDYQTEIKSAQSADTEEGGLQLRKLEAEVRMAEVKLAKEEGSVVTLDDMDKMLAAPLYELRAKLLALPSKWAPSMVGCRTIAEAQARLDVAVEEAMQALSSVGDEIDNEADHARDEE